MARILMTVLGCFVLSMVAIADETTTTAPEDAPLEEMKVEKVFTPEKCERLTKKHDIVKMHYDGVLTDGTKFDSSRDHGEPIQFQLGIGQVIAGWEQGLLDMCVGEKRKLTIPPHLGYGDNPAGEKIPAKSTLLFDVELMEIQDGPAPENIFKKLDTNNDNQLSPDEVQAFMKEQAKGAGDEINLEPGEQDRVLTEIFQHEDKDKDGFIQYHEFSGTKHDDL